MADIDMIPRTYRNTERVRRRLRKFALAFAALVLAGAGLGAVLHWRVGRAEIELEKMRADAVRANSGATALTAARANKALLVQAGMTLTALRGAGDTVQVADAIETALVDGLRVEQLSFTREAQQVAGSGPAVSGQIVVPAAPGGAGAAESWQVRRLVEISGTANDYGTLTRFVGRLSAQHRLAEVRLLRSSGAGSDPRARAADLDARPVERVQFAIGAVLGGMR